MSRSNKQSTWPHFFISFGVLLFISLIVLSALKMAPLCSSSILSKVSAVQYVDFLLTLKHALLGLAGKAYSFSNSLCGGMYANWTTYCLSPFNLVLFLVPRSAYSVAVLFESALKTSTAAMAAQACANYQSGGRWYSLFFSISYGLSGFLVSNFCNIMWMDGVILYSLLVCGM